MKSIHPKSRKAWRNWLEKNHLKEKSVILIKYKKHTGKPTITNMESMEDAICFGWIDTTIKKIDEERYCQTFMRRNKNSKWSKNTLSYGKRLLKEGRMSPFGIKMYKEGLAKKPHDHGINRNPRMPPDLKKALMKNKTAWENYQNMAPSYQRLYKLMVAIAKRPETREKRIKDFVQRLKENKKPNE